MDKRFIFLGSLVTFFTLVIGLLVGFLAGTIYSSRVHAQDTPPVEEVTPQLTAGSAAFGTLLAGRAAVDNLSVQGLDLLKFDQNVLNLLNSKSLFFTHDEIQGVINNSRAEKILKVKTPVKPQEKKP
jgi:hypothetical protein